MLKKYNEQINYGKCDFCGGNNIMVHSYEEDEKDIRITKREEFNYCTCKDKYNWFKNNGYSPMSEGWKKVYKEDEF